MEKVYYQGPEDLTPLNCPHQTHPVEAELPPYLAAHVGERSRAMDHKFNLVTEVVKVTRKSTYPSIQISARRMAKIAMQHYPPTSIPEVATTHLALSDMVGDMTNIANNEGDLRMGRINFANYLMMQVAEYSAWETPLDLICRGIDWVRTTEDSRDALERVADDLNVPEEDVPWLMTKIFTLGQALHNRAINGRIVQQEPAVKDARLIQTLGSKSYQWTKQLQQQGWPDSNFSVHTDTTNWTFISSSSLRVEQFSFAQHYGSETRPEEWVNSRYLCIEHKRDELGVEELLYSANSEDFYRVCTIDDKGALFNDQFCAMPLQDSYRAARKLHNYHILRHFVLGQLAEPRGSIGYIRGTLE